ncbi:MAG: hypothetical protein K8L91_31725 [Anaerolineae bacterium]|nr:hypothetical protein [Anaerolineae bacterium]
MKPRKNLTIGFLAIVAAMGFGFSKGVSPVASRDDMPLIYMPTDWSPDGSQILFSSNRSGNFDIWFINADDTNVTNLTGDYLGMDGDASWSPDGKTIAFSSDRESQSQSGLPVFDLWLMDSDGSNLRNLTSDIEESIGGLAWSPDGNHLAFAVIKMEVDSLQIYGEIWSISLLTGEKSRVSPISEGNTSYEGFMFAFPAWTPDGSLAYVASKVGQVGEVWISSVTSSNREQFYVNQPVGEIRISPDGSMIICTTFPRTDGESMRIDLVLLDTQNGETMVLTSEMPNFNSYPEWSPDSSQIAFQSSDGNSSDIWVVSSDGAGFTNLTAGHDSFDTLPVWSPNGEQIAFVSDRSGESNIWIMNADDSNPINLTGNAIEN